MSNLSDDIWRKILEQGTKMRKLDNRDLCNVAMINPRFNELSNEPSLWATVLSQDFPKSHYQYVEAPSKSLYRKMLREEQQAVYEARRSSLQENYRVDIDEFGWILANNPPGNGRPVIQVRKAEDNVYEMYINHPSCSRVHYITVNSKPETDPIIQRRALLLEQKFRKSCNIGPKTKSVPNSRHYQPLHKPPRRAMAPRKI